MKGLYRIVQGLMVALFVTLMLGIWAPTHQPEWFATSGVLFFILGFIGVALAAENEKKRVKDDY